MNVTLAGEGGPLDEELWEKWCTVLTRPQQAVYRQLVELRDDRTTETDLKSLASGVGLSVGKYHDVLEELAALKLVGLDGG